MSDENRTESRVIMKNNNNNSGGSDTPTWEHHQNRHGQFGDTTETKIFVGGLPWSTRNESVENYFKQFGEILEAVVITDKHTGRSKGYGFVTFKDPESAIRACEDSSPIIDGRRANCNIAAIGANQRSTSSFASRQGQGVRVPRRKSSPMTQDYVSSSPAQQQLKNRQFFHYAPSPFFYYGYNGYSQDMYNNYYNAYYSSMGLSSPAALATYYNYYQLQNQPKLGNYSPGATSQTRQPPAQILLQQQHSSPVVSSNGTVTEKTEEIEVRGACERREEDGETGSISSS